MASAITLDGPAPRRRGLGSTETDGGCRCSRKPNPKTGKRVKLCPVPKTKTHRSGWTIAGWC